MHDIEVYGVAVRRYGNTGTAECFVPRLIGATARRRGAEAGDDLAGGEAAGRRA